MNPTRRFRELRLFWKLLIPFATLLVIVGAFGAFVLIRDQASRAQSALNRDLQEASLQVRSTLQQRELYLLESGNLAANLQGMAGAVADADAATTTELLRSVVALKGELDVVAVIGPDGAPLAVLGPAGTPSAVTLDPGAAFIAAALTSADGGRQAGFVTVDGSTLLAIAAPICSTPDPCTPVGSAVVAQDLGGVLDGLAAGDLVERLAGGGLALFDAEGQLLAEVGATPDTLSPTEVTGSGLVRVAGEADGEQVQTLYAPYRVQGTDRGTVAVTLPVGPEFAAVQGTGLRLTLVLLLALAGIVAVGAAVSRAILRQVGPLVETNRRLGSGDLSARVPVVSGDEIGEVARGLNQMADQLQASYQTLESRVEQRTAEVKRLLEQRTEFFASLSHELRTPLAIVLSQSELLLLDDHGDDVSDTARAIRQSAIQLLGVVGEILELARAEAGTLEVSPEPLSLSAFTVELAPTLNGLAHAGDVELTIDIPAELPLVAADPQRLREIVVNLADNAVKYSPAGAQVAVSAQEVGGHVVVHVSDDGQGIPDHVGDRLFEPFFRVEGTRPREGQASTGLGLALTRRLVEAHGGDITYDSEVGEGTTFRFTLPLADVSASNAGEFLAGIRR